MNKKLLTAITLTVLISLSAFASYIHPVIASETIYIHPDGRIEPTTAPIASTDNTTYTCSGPITGTVVVLRDNIVLDGADNTLQGPGNGKGIDVSYRTNVTITNLTITAFSRGIYLHSSANIIIRGNHIESNICGIKLHKSSNTTIAENTIKTNIECGISLQKTSNSKIFHNDFLDNVLQVEILSSGYANVWDDGYPSGGNYWSDYTGVDFKSGPYQNETGTDGIGDTPNTFDAHNHDHYPLMEPWATIPTQSTEYPWPMLHHNVRHTGYTESPAPTTNQKLWNYTTGDAVTSSPAIANGKVFVGSHDGNIYALDQYTGTLRWNYTTGGAIASSPAVATGRVIVGSNDHTIYCFNASTGAPIWTYTTNGAIQSSPAVIDDHVFVGSDDAKIYCLDAATGDLLWSYTTGGAVASSPAVAAGQVYVGSVDDTVYCLNAADGTLVWAFTTGGDVSSSPTVAGTRMYVGSWDHKVYCLDTATGDLLWSYTTGDQVHSSPAIAGGKVYVGSQDDNIYCLDAATGAYVWTFTTDGDVSSSPAVAFDLEAEDTPYDSRVYVGSLDGRIYCLDAATGMHLWNYTTGEAVAASPAVADGILVIGSQDHAVYAFGNIIRVPEDYPTIQEAVDAATSGATITIAPGNYGPLIIDKSLTILGRTGSSATFDGGGSGIAIIITGVSEVTVTNIVVTNWDQGIFVSDSSDCKIYKSTMSSNDIAINLTESSSGITIYANTISENEVGIDLSDSTDVIIYHNNFVDNVENTRNDDVAGIWHNGYPSGGNYWSGHTGTDDYRGPNQDEPGSDGIYDNAFDIDLYNQDSYPLTKLYSGQHDIGITNLTTSKTVVGQGYPLDITIETLNYGIEPETSSVETYAQTTLIDQRPIALVGRNSSTDLFTWNTEGIPYGNYTISAYAYPVLGETDTTDNIILDGWVLVTIPGDVNGDGKVRVDDILAVALAFGSNIGDSRYDPNLDINSDLKIRVDDVLTAALNFGLG